MEVTHSVKDELNLSCGCALVTRPSAFASVSVSYSFFIFPILNRCKLLLLFVYLLDLLRFEYGLGRYWIM